MNNEEILRKVDEIIKEIEDSSDYKKYLLLKDKISNNKEVMSLIKKVKVLQKDVVHNIDKKDELACTLEKLNNHPLYREYNNTLDELNNTFNIIENGINHYFFEKLN